MSANKIIDLQEVRKKEKKKNKKINRKNKIRKKYKIKNPKRFAVIVCVLAIIFGIPIYHIVELTIEKSNLKKEKIRLEKEIKKLQEEKDEAHTSDYIEKKAREMLNLVLPGEIIYIPQKSNESGDKNEN